MLLLRDISPRKHAERALQEANQAMQAHLEEINLLHEQLREQAIRDSLTGLYNRRYLQETLERELARARRENHPVCTIMIDVDHFKQINDSCGHATGDQILEGLGLIIRNFTRREDFPCRYGGEEFVIVLPRMSEEDAIDKANEIRLSFNNLCRSKLGPDNCTTLSVGIAMFPDQAGIGDTLLAAADRALYQAKAAGRNQVVVIR
jgi:diguanylate cyclase (GGDEF)-like protein